MANVKITELPVATGITSDDLLPIVESGSVVTQQANFQQVLAYVTSSTFNSLVVNTGFTSDVEITGTLAIKSGHVNLDSNAYFLQGTSTGASNVSLIGVNLHDQVVIGNAGYQNILDNSTYVSGNLEVSGTATLSGIQYPTADGDNGQILVTDGAGTLSFQEIAMTIRVKNLEATQIDKGTPLYVTASGTSGNIAGVYRADAGNASRMPAACVANEDIASGAEGLALLNGFINNVDTNGFASGEAVYVGVGGGYTNTRPTGSALVQPLGYVEKVDANGSGVVQGPGHHWELPNTTAGHFWVGDSNGVPTTVASSSFAKLAADNTFTGTNTFSILSASTIDVDTITAREYYTEVVSASIIYQSGSTKFGDSADDTHQFTGSIQQNGSVDNYLLGRLAVGSSTLSNVALAMDVNGQIEATAFKTNYAVSLGLESGFLRIGFRNSTGIAAQIVGNMSGKTLTSGILTDVNFREGAAFAPTSGDAEFNSVVFTHTINQTGTATGITRGLLLESNLTSAEDYRGLEFLQDSHWAIYQSGSNAKNYFAGQVGVGTNTPTATLEVSGTFIGDVYVSGTVSAPITDASYTLGSVDRGRTLLFSSSATQAITCSAGFSTGYNCTFVQMGSGQLVLSASSGVSILNRQTHNGSAGLYAAISVVVIDNDTYLLAGDTA